jgi:predicted HTH domain antitoxin
MPITVLLEIPDDLAAILRSPGRDFSRTALEALVIEEYRAKRLSDAQLRRILGLSRFQAEGFLKAHGVWLDYSIDDFHQEAEAGRRVSQRSR